MLIASAKSRSVRGASHQPAFMSSSLLVTRICPVYLVEELVLVFLVLLEGRKDTWGAENVGCG